jgi:hypothetical protein
LQRKKQTKEKINLEEKEIINSIIEPIKNGKFICTIVKDKKTRKNLIGIFKKYKIGKRRGFFGFNGYTALVFNLPKEYEKYFDSIVRII